jgi:hypothetical protein
VKPIRRIDIAEELNLREEEALRHDGHRAAAWLVRRHRKKLHQNGEMVFVIEVGKVAPSWFRIGVEFLKRRRGWNAIITAQAGQRTYRVIWLARGRWKARTSEVALWQQN